MCAIYGAFALIYEYCLSTFMIFYFRDYDNENNMFYSTAISIPLFVALALIVWH